MPIVYHHHVYGHHVDDEQTRNYHGHTQLGQHYNKQDHRDNDRDNNREGLKHHGTHPSRKSHHSNNRVSNPNISHHNKVNEHTVSHSTYIHHSHGQKNSTITTSPNHLPKSPVTTHPTGTPHPKVNPVTPPTTNSKPAGKPTTNPANNPIAPKTPIAAKPRFSGQAPPHHGLIWGAGNPNPAVRPYGANNPGQGAASHVSAVNKQGKSTSVTTMQEHDPQATGNPVRDWLSNAGSTLSTWASNATTTKPETQQQLANDPVYQGGKWEDQQLRTIGTWYKNALHDIGIDVTP